MKAIDKPTLSALLLGLISACFIALSINSVYRGQLKVDNLRSQYYQSRDDAFDQIEDQSFITKSISEYQRVMKSVGAGPTQRRSWIEALSDAKDNLNLSEVRFDIYPLIPIEISASEYPIDIDIGYEAIDLTLGLVHEGQLLKLFEYLAENISTPFEITSLNIQRIGKKIDNGITTSKEINLQVVCTIRWYSIGVIGGDNAIAQG